MGAAAAIRTVPADARQRDARHPRDAELQHVLVGDQHQRPAAFLRLVPGVEQRFFVMPIGGIEQAATNPCDEIAREQRSP